MFELVKNDYTYGINHGPDWTIHINQATRPVKTYFEETIESTISLYEKVGGPWSLLYSGGLDSHYALNVLQYLNIPVEPVIINLTDNAGLTYNNEEIKYAFEYCQEKNIKANIVNFNYEEFLDSGEIIEIAEKFKIGSYRIPARLKVAGQQDNFVILGDNPPYITSIDGKWYFEELEVTYSQLNFFKQNKIHGTPFILSYTPEMMLAFLLDPAINKLANNYWPGKLGTNSSKAHVYNNGSGFNMKNYDFKSKNRIKLTGFEKIDQSRFANHPSIIYMEEKLRSNWGGIYLEEYFHLVERLSPHNE
jgi:hypothetical protein